MIFFFQKLLKSGPPRRRGITRGPLRENYGGMSRRTYDELMRDGESTEEPVGKSMGDSVEASMGTYEERIGTRGDIHGKHMKEPLVSP